MILKAIVVLALSIGWRGLADAQYVLVLKNGRQITVQSYRDDGAVIRFSSLGGDIAIGKDQVQSIRRASDTEKSAMDDPSLSPLPSSSVPKSAETKPSTAPPARAAPVSDSRDEEERAYQRKVKELTEQIRELRDRYALLTRGNTGPEPKLFTTEEEFRGHQEDLLSRLRDAQYRSQGLPAGAKATAPPFSLDAPPAYSEKQKELSELRRRMGELENARQKLIDEMKSKKFDTGSLFID